MKKRVLYFMASAVIFVASCGPKTTEGTEDMDETTELSTEETTVEEENYFGEMIDGNGALSVDEFSMKMQGKDTVRTKIRAIAEDVCQKKGCWMKVKTADGKMMRIKFKDYGFFVPMDITGKEVVFEGIAFRDTTSVEDLKHYAEDGGQSAEEIAAITEPEVNTSFIADGVMIAQK